MHASPAVHELSSLHHLRARRSRGARSARFVSAALVLGAALAPPALALPAGSTSLIDRPFGDVALPFDGLRYSILQSRQSMSADGNLVVFESESDALHAGEGDRTERYVYVRNRSAGTTTNLCRATNGTIGNQGCNEIGISPNGRYVVFRSGSTNLVAGGGYPGGWIYRRDLQTGATELMSRATGANGAGQSSGYITTGTGVANDGTVVFATTASLSAVDAGNTRPDVYARIGTETRLISKTSGNVIGNGSSEAPTISGDGTVVAFESDATNFAGTDANGKRDVFTTPVSAAFTPTLGSRRTVANESGNNESRGPSLDLTGRYLGFSTSATNLFSTPITTDANGVSDVILRDTIGNTNTVASIGAGNVPADGDGAYGAVVSADGSKIAFAGDIPAFGASFDRAATFVRNPAAGTTTLVSRSSGGAVIGGGTPGGLTSDGGVVVFGGQSDDSGTDEAQIFVRLTASNQTQHVSIPSGTAPAGPFASDAWAGRGAVSADGGLVGFTTKSPAITGVPFDGFRHAVIRNLRTGALRLLDAAPGGAAGAGDVDGVVVSADGSTAAFASYADNLHPEASGDSAHVFVVDLASGAISVADRDTAGQVAGGLGEPDISLSDDGKVVAFTTEAKLDPVADTNMDYDAYVRDLRTGAVQLASRRDGAGGAVAAGGVWSVVLSGDGKRLGFSSTDPNLVAGDANAKTDAFVRDLAAGTTILVSRIDGPGGAPGNGNSTIDDLSTDGLRASFTTVAANLGNGDTTTGNDVHVRDLVTGQTLWASRPENGVQPNDSSGGGDLSGDGTRIAFSTRATNLVTPDGNGTDYDTYLRDLGSGALARIGVTGAGGQPAADVTIAALSSNGRCALLQSSSSDLVDGGYASPDYEHLYLRAIDADCPGPLPNKQDDPPKQDDDQPKTVRDTLAPTLAKLALTRKAFATKGKKKGSSLTFTLDEPANVKVAVATTKPGKQKGKICVKPSKAKKRAKKCTLVGAPKDVTTVKGTAGKNTVQITGWAKGKRLPKGTYRLLLTATDAAGNRTAAPVAIDFRIKG